MIKFEYPGQGNFDCSDGCVMVLGFFDGVHLAHRQLLKKAKTLSCDMRLPLVVFTFPSEESALKAGTPRLYSSEEKLHLLEKCGADVTVLCDFSAVKDIGAEAFIDKIIVSDFNARAVVCGFNFRFGKGGEGNSALLKQQLENKGRICLIVDKYDFEGAALSSSRIKDFLANAYLPLANRALDAPYFISGTVSHGNGDGHKYGIPTVNTSIEPWRVALPRGVYSTVLETNGIRYPSLTNIGTCPTFGERTLHAETFIMNFSGSIYGERVRVYFLGYLRPERCFDSAEELVKQIERDKIEAMRLAEETKWQEAGLN